MENELLTLIKKYKADLAQRSKEVAKDKGDLRDEIQPSFADFIDWLEKETK